MIFGTHRDIILKRSVKTIITITMCRKEENIMVFEKIRKIVADQLGADENEITKESTFIEDLGADSLDVVELVMAIEDEFDMEIDEDEAEGISTVGDVVDYIKANCDNL